MPAQESQSKRIHVANLGVELARGCRNHCGRDLTAGREQDWPHSQFIEIPAEPLRDFGQRCARPSRGGFPNNGRDLLLFSAEIFEPSIDESLGDWCEREGINPDVELVLDGAVLVIVDVAMQQKDPVVDRPMSDVAIVALGISGVGIVGCQHPAPVRAPDTTSGTIVQPASSYSGVERSMALLILADDLTMRCRVCSA